MTTAPVPVSLFTVLHDAGLPVLVETATGAGDLAYAAGDIFDTVITMEADKALYEAKASGKARVRVHRLPGVPDYDRSTMVQSDEKQFLFSGNDD